ncbi:MAG: cytochrome-c peroxidase [Saprospiraceae bacterium]|nr:cytochrome-c peroxidase [Saprospiraceae bacterium]
MKTKNIFIAFALLLMMLSCAPEKEDQTALNKIDHELLEILKSQSPNSDISFFALPGSQEFSKIPQDPKNPITKEKVVLGGFLFHETALGVEGKDPSLKGTFSCASCHHAGAGFQAGTFQGIGEGGLGFGVRGEMRKSKTGFNEPDVQPLRSPTAMNGAYQKNQLWNGQFGATHLNNGTEKNWGKGTPIETNFLGFEGLETQAIAGMGVHRLNINKQILEMKSYIQLFDLAFPNVPTAERYNRTTAGLAIAAYERTVMSNEAPFQLYLKGDLNAMSNIEKEGAKLFFTKAECGTCHTGPALNSMQFNAIGLKDMLDCPEPTLNTKENDPANLGRGGFTKNSADNYKFKVPQLYNLKDSPFYGHGSTFRKLRDILVYKNNAVAENKRVPTSQLDPNFRPLGLTNEEINAIEAFISTALYDRNLKRFVPQSLPSGQCFPNADIQSKIDMNCF